MARLDLASMQGPAGSGEFSHFEDAERIFSPEQVVNNSLAAGEGKKPRHLDVR